ncbi:MAG: hypothetical protein QMC85_06940 [Methanocellales archaeon]|nr:hypothetical protein [Methanocellales archaeon]
MMDGGTLGLLGVTWAGIIAYIIQHNRNHNRIAEEIGKLNGKMDMLLKHFDLNPEEAEK